MTDDPQRLIAELKILLSQEREILQRQSDQAGNIYALRLGNDLDYQRNRIDTLTEKVNNLAVHVARIEASYQRVFKIVDDYEIFRSEIERRVYTGERGYEQANALKERVDAHEQFISSTKQIYWFLSRTQYKLRDATKSFVSRSQKRLKAFFHRVAESTVARVIIILLGTLISSPLWLRVVDIFVDIWEDISNG